ncbi:MAG: GlmL-related ornithine degradation protein [Defluviitaleaceae bacterium]|nr:GlmL-related ornithine degradation protein [Defluviitaleaceae bacterium]
MARIFADVLVAEVGSTTTVVNAFDLNNATIIAQGRSPTTVLGGDVRIGLHNAISDLEANLGGKVIYKEMVAASSAAGGLKMCVHGLVYDMTVRAAREAALGAGAVLKLVTAGKLQRTDIAKIKETNPNIILIAGGLDYGERETAIYNFEKLAQVISDVPFIYAGNTQNHDEIRLIAEEFGVKVTIAENVYPSVDTLNTEPTRRIIQNVFEEHIIHAPGMAGIRGMVTGKIMPTPGAVMAAAKLLYEELGDLIVFDVGGATTDLHSVTPGSTEYADMQTRPEPLAKRTVEGDLGVYVNIPHIIEKIGMEELLKEFPNIDEILDNLQALPRTDDERSFVTYLTRTATGVALDRHVGRMVDFYGVSGKKTMVTGKDLTAVKYIIGTGGALTGLSGGARILGSLPETKTSMRLTPRHGAEVLIDNNYIMASAGVLSAVYPEAALTLMLASLNKKMED